MTVATSPSSTATSTPPAGGPAADTDDWNPYYVAFARVHGRQPEEQRAHDAAHVAGAKMMGFILWIHRQWRAVRAEVSAQDGRRRGDHDTREPAEQVALVARLAALGPCAGCIACQPSADDTGEV